MAEQPGGTEGGDQESCTARGLAHLKSLKKLSSVVYRIQDKRPGSRKRVVVHFDRLKPCPDDIRVKPVVDDLHNSDANEHPVQLPGSNLQFFLKMMIMTS